MPEVSPELELKVRKFIHPYLERNTSQRTIRRLIMKKFGTEITAELQVYADRKNAQLASRRKWSPVYWIKRLFNRTQKSTIHG